MAGRRTNLVLFVLLAAALASGTVAFALGTPAGRVAVWSHAVVGFGLVVLTPWKSVVVRRGMRRRRSGRAASVAFGVLVVASVAAGVAHSAGTRGVVLGVTAMQVHVGAALVAIPLGVWHVVARPVRPRRTDLSRRAALRTGGVLAAAAAIWLGTESLWRLAGLPGARRRFTGSHEVGTGRPEAMPVTQWFDDRVPDLDAGSWRLRVVDADGARLLSLADLSADERVRATLDCTGGWYAEQTWDGVPLDRLVRVGADARSVVVRSATGYARRFPLDDLPLLATAVGGAPLSAGHGFPARAVAPGRRGFWWVKWVVEVRVDDRPAWLQPPFPLT